ncbi:MAG TPA: hypothetical protein VFF70_08915 [Anaerolineae bacterium]|jgi:hypothetical protein|nr:hypothetical protein [Anaerolineae bacterium]
MTTEPVTNKSIWIDRLQQWGLGGVASTLIDVLRPLGFFGSQAISMASPVLTTFVDPDRLDRLAGLLEDPDRLTQLSRLLAESPEDPS